MDLTRRTILALTSGAMMAGRPTRSDARIPSADEAMAALTGDHPVEEGGIRLVLPDIAEDGYSVPVEVEAPGARAVTLFVPLNPEPVAATITFGRLSAARRAVTRLRLATTQDVIAIAAMEDGSFRKTSTFVTVTIGGCGHELHATGN